MNSYYTDSELRRIGFLKVGACVKISRKASFYRPESILINDYVRIDDFCILIGHSEIGDTALRLLSGFECLIL